MLLILAAAPLETVLLRKNIVNPQQLSSGSHQVISGILQGRKVLLAHIGIGSVNTAVQLTRLLNEHSPLAILLCGCGGCYPKSGLKVGDLALADREIYGDLGAMTATGFIPLDLLDIPQDTHWAPVVQQSYPLNPELLIWAKNILPDAVSGTFITVNCCSGTSDLSEMMQQRTGAICENMEGAAAAQVCAEFDIPILELRGISNPTGTRDPERWDIIKGAEAAQFGIMKLLQNWPIL